MLFVRDGAEAGYGNGACAAGVELVLPFVADAVRGGGVDFVDEEGVGAVEFVGVDAGVFVSMSISMGSR